MPGILNATTPRGPVTNMDPTALVPGDWYVGGDGQGNWGVFHPMTGPADPLIAGLTEEQANLGAILMREEGVPWYGRNPFDVRADLEDALAPEKCVICGNRFARAQMHNERCVEDQS